MNQLQLRAVSLAFVLASTIALGQTAATGVRPWRTSDLLITLPRPDMLAALRPAVLDLETLVGSAKAQTIVDHLLMQDATFATRDGVELDALEKQSWLNIWSKPFDTEAFKTTIADGRRPTTEDRDRYCLSSLANWRLRAVRFSPVEVGLAGTPQDWRTIFGQDGISRVIELRFVFGTECSLTTPRGNLVIPGDNGVHVTYRLDPSRRGLPSPIVQADLLEKAALANDQDAVRAAAQTYADHILAEPYRTWWTERVTDWKALMSGMTDAASVSINAAPFKLLAAERDPSSADKTLSQLVNSTFSSESANVKEAELGWPSLADGTSPAAQHLRAGLLRFAHDEATLHAVTTFSAHDFESWTFGKLSLDENNNLGPVELHTFETNVRSTKLKDIDVVVSSSVGFFDNGMEFDAGNIETNDPEVIAGLKVRVADAALFLKNNFTLSNIADTCENTPLDPFCSTPLADKLAKVNTPARTNASNATCSGCHLSLTKGLAPATIGAFPGVTLQMLTGKGPQLNVRTAREIEATLSELR